MRTGITKIYLADGLGSTPARVNRITGELYLNREKWNELDPTHRLFILLHEAGHVDLGTRNEIKADNYAFDHYANMGYPLSQSVKALTQVLHFNNPQHYDRVNEQIRRAFNYDYYINKNEKANPQKMENYLENAYNSSFTGNQYSGNDFDNFFLEKLFPKKMRQAIKAKVAQKEAQTEAKTAQAKATSAEANAKTLKAQADSVKSTKIIDAAKPPAPVEVVEAEKMTPTGSVAPANKKTLFIAAGVAVVVIVLIVFFLKRKK